MYLGRRADPIKVEQSNQAVLAQLENGQLSPDTLYVLSNTPTHQQWLNQQEFSRDTCVVKINHLIAIGPHWPDCYLTVTSTNQ